MTGEEEHRAKIRTLWTTRRAGLFVRPRLKQFIIHCRRRRRMSTLPLLLECSTISRLCKSITPPPLSLSHPFHQRSNPSPHSSGQSPPCSPAHGKTTSLGRLGVVERKRAPPLGIISPQCAELTDSPCLRLRFCLSAPRLPPCSEPFPVRNRAKRSAWSG